MLSVAYTNRYAGCCSAQCRYAKCRYAQCRYAMCHNAKCRYAECHYAECRGTNPSYINRAKVSQIGLLC